MLRDGTYAYLWAADARRYQPNPLQASVAASTGRREQKIDPLRVTMAPASRGATCRRRLACCAPGGIKISARSAGAGQRPEVFFADRAVEVLRQQMAAEAPAVEISEIEAVRLDSGKLAEITSPSLFSSQRAAVITELENLAPELDADLVNLAGAQVPDLAVIVVHRGVLKGRALLEKLKSAGVEVIECAQLWGAGMGASSSSFQRKSSRLAARLTRGAATALSVDAVGHDLGLWPRRSDSSSRMGCGCDHRRSRPPLLRWSV